MSLIKCFVFVLVLACTTHLSGASSSFEGAWEAQSVSCTSEEGLVRQTIPEQNADILDRIRFYFISPHSVIFQMPFAGGLKNKPGTAICTQMYYSTYAYSFEKRTFTFNILFTEVENCTQYSDQFEHGKKNMNTSFEALGGIDIDNSRVLYIENIMHIQHLLGLDHLDHEDNDCGLVLVLKKTHDL